MLRFLFVSALAAASLSAQTAPSVAKLWDGQLTNIENELVPLVEAMPADKFGFAPTGGAFTGVRTFAMQATHVAAVLYAVSAAVLGEANPTQMGTAENGPENLKSKEQIVKYVKDAFAYGHKAMLSLTAANEMELVKSPFGANKTPRVANASSGVWHSFDHYGQMVVYARMNNVVPPASR